MISSSRLSALFCLLTIFTFSSASDAQIDRNEPTLKVSPKLPLEVEYEFPGWNKDPKKIDQGALIIRDGKSKQVAKIILQETDVNSGNFYGRYVLTFAYDQGEVNPEIYSPPLSLTKKEQALKEIAKMIESGALLRKPSLLRKNRVGMQKLQVFDSREQAAAALEAFRKGTGKSPVDSNVIENQQKIAFEAEKARLRSQALSREEQRKGLVAVENKRLSSEMAKWNALSPAERKRRTDEANRYFVQGATLAQEQKHAESEAAFRKAIELNPSNRSYHFRHGAALLQMQKHDDSILALRLASGKDINPQEVNYYIGLNHVQLKEYDQAMSMFESIKLSQDPNYGSMASFYQGIVEYTRENYEAAKPHFQYTLDNSSNNPQIDAQAETYIEQIAAILQFEELKKKKWMLTLSLGEQYDSNVLSQPTGDPVGTATDKEGYRTMFMANLSYRPIFSATQEMLIALSYIDMYTLDKSFGSSASLQQADPYVMGISLPYKFIWPTYQVLFTPGHEITHMDADGAGNREAILRANYLKADNTFIASENYFSNLNLEYRIEDSLLDSSETPAADADATKISLASVNTYFTDKKKTTAVIGEASYSLNTAKGDDATYNHLEFAAGYLMPIFWESSLMTRLAWFQQKYPDHSLSRADNSTGLSLAMSKAFTTELSGSLSAGYNQNSSNIGDYTYDKYTLMAMCTWMRAF